MIVKNHTVPRTSCSREVKDRIRTCQDRVGRIRIFLGRYPLQWFVPHQVFDFLIDLDQQLYLMLERINEEGL